MNPTISLALLVCFCMTTVLAMKDMMRKSIVFDKNTPDVFYCPIQKPSGMEKLIVKARPLKKLCEFEGQPLPEDYKSDCYQDVDESNYACKEKYRIMMRTAPPGSEKPFENKRLARFLDVDKEFYIAAMEEKKNEDTTENAKKKRSKSKKRT
ncbi:hypothetical protein HHI36_021996 [Cryptolaemus montrouzieri]|uniref:Uncharacterized protein n=1 Tax=Cryptolaemus montrouzieri TaxID=559131 RepID=A0ABD2MYV5_9CUCU